jgi:hypothetical protein
MILAAAQRPAGHAPQPRYVPAHGGERAHWALPSGRWVAPPVVQHPLASGFGTPVAHTALPVHTAGTPIAHAPLDMPMPVRPHGGFRDVVFGPDHPMPDDIAALLAGLLGRARQQPVYNPNAGADEEARIHDWIANTYPTMYPETGRNPRILPV